MTPEHIKENLGQWIKDEAFHTIAGACGDLIREVEVLREMISEPRVTGVARFLDGQLRHASIQDGDQLVTLYTARAITGMQSMAKSG